MITSAGPFGFVGLLSREALHCFVRLQEEVHSLTLTLVLLDFLVVQTDPFVEKDTSVAFCIGLTTKSFGEGVTTLSFSSTLVWHTSARFRRSLYVRITLAMYYF